MKFVTSSLRSNHSPFAYQATDHFTSIHTTRNTKTISHAITIALLSHPLLRCSRRALCLCADYYGHGPSLVACASSR